VAARRSNSISAIVAELPALQLVIERGEADSTARREIMELIERRRRLVDSEIKRRIAAQESLTIDEAAHLVHVLSSSVVRNVTDPEARARIAQDIRAVFESFR
jgi:hypothetical protein